MQFPEALTSAGFSWTVVGFMDLLHGLRTVLNCSSPPCGILFIVRPKTSISVLYHQFWLCLCTSCRVLDQVFSLLLMYANQTYFTFDPWVYTCTINLHFVRGICCTINSTLPRLQCLHS